MREPTVKTREPAKRIRQRGRRQSRETAVDNPYSMSLTFPLSLSEMSFDAVGASLEKSLVVSFSLSIDVGKYLFGSKSKGPRRYSSLLICVPALPCHYDMSMPDRQLIKEIAGDAGSEAQRSTSLKDQTSRIRCCFDQKEIVSEKPENGRRATQCGDGGEGERLRSDAAERQGDRQSRQSEAYLIKEIVSEESTDLPGQEIKWTEGTTVSSDHKVLWWTNRMLLNTNYRTLRGDYILWVKDHRHGRLPVSL